MAHTLKINGTTQVIDVEADMPLLWVLRDILGLKGTKFGCGMAQCGACTVHLDGVATRSCVLPVGNVGERAITTIEALDGSDTGRRLQAAWVELDVPQCGYCQAGQLMSAAALLATNPAPDDATIISAMEGNICRCASYPRIRAAIRRASGREAGALFIDAAATDATATPEH